MRVGWGDLRSLKWSHPVSLGPVKETGINKSELLKLKRIKIKINSLVSNKTLFPVQKLFIVF